MKGLMTCKKCGNVAVNCVCLWVDWSNGMPVEDEYIEFDDILYCQTLHAVLAEGLRREIFTGDETIDEITFILDMLFGKDKIEDAPDAVIEPVIDTPF